MSTGVKLEQEDLDLIKKSVLIHHRKLLVDSVDPASHLSYLRSKFVLDERDAEEIRAPPSRSARCETFLDKLGRKGSEGYDEFCNSLLRDRTQLFLLTAMTKTLELLKHKVKAYKENQAQVKVQQQAVPPMRVLQQQLRPNPRQYHYPANFPAPHHAVPHQTPRPQQQYYTSLPPSTHPHHYNRHYQGRGFDSEDAPYPYEDTATEPQLYNEQGPPLHYPPPSEHYEQDMYQPQVLQNPLGSSSQEQPCGQPI